MIHCLNTVVSKDLMILFSLLLLFWKDVFEKNMCGTGCCHWRVLLSGLTYLRQYYKRNASEVAEVTGSLVASAEVVSIQLPFLNHQSKPPNFFSLLVFLLCWINWLSNSVSRRRRNLCLCGTLGCCVPRLWSCLSTLSFRVTWSRSMHIQSYLLKRADFLLLLRYVPQTGRKQSKKLCRIHRSTTTL